MVVADWREKLALSPASVMLLTLLFIVLTQGAAVYTLLQQPWTGLRLEPDTASGFVRVVAVDPGSPADGNIPVSVILTSLTVADEKIPLTSNLFMYAFLQQNYRTYEVSLNHQVNINQGLVSGKLLMLTDQNNQQYVLIPQRQTPLHSIPVYFWVFLATFSIIPLLSAFVWSYKPNTRGVAFLFFAGVGCYGFHFVGTLNFAKEFFFDRQITEFLLIVELVFLNIYIPSIFTLMSLYPHKLFPYKFLVGFLALHSFYSVNFYFSWFALPEYYLALQSVVPFGFGLIASQIQVKRSLHDPIERTVARIIQLSMTLPFVPIILLHILPIAFGQEPWLNKNFAQILGGTSFIGLAIGILRFRLFEVEYWWFKSWLWLLGGCVVVLVDLLLIGLLNTPQLYALGLSVVLTGFLYFPLRQWLLGKWMPLENQSLQDFLARFSTSLAQADSPEAFEQGWQALLQARFAPQHLTLQAATLTQPQLEGNGLSLRVPALTSAAVYQLSGKQMASRLFNKADVKTVTALLDIARMARNASDAREQAVREERERLLHDLNATVGAKLRRLADDLPEAEHREATEDALQALDATVKLSLQADPFSLQAHLQAWQVEIAHRTAAAAVQLDWQVDDGLQQGELSSKQALELTQFLREAVTNALKHAQPSRLTVRFAREVGSLQVSISNDGKIQPPDTWQAGTGMSGMAARMRTLHGEWHIQHLAPQGYVRLDALIPLLRYE